MDPLLLLLPLASAQLTETVINGEIFAGVREAWPRRIARMEQPWRALLMPGEALKCSFCFSHWAAAVVVLLYFLGIPGAVVILWLAVLRLGSMMNDFAFLLRRATEPQQPDIKGIPDDIFEEDLIRRTGHGFPVPSLPIQRTHKSAPATDTFTPDGENWPQTGYPDGTMEGLGESEMPDGLDSSADEGAAYTPFGVERSSGSHR